MTPKHDAIRPAQRHARERMRHRQKSEINDKLPVFPVEPICKIAYASVHDRISYATHQGIHVR